MFCRECGREVDPSSSFCAYCGADVSNGMEPTPRPIPAPRHMSLRPLAVIVLFVVIGTALLLAFLPDDDSIEKSYTVGDMTVYGDLVNAPIVIQDGMLVYSGQGTNVIWKYKDVHDTYYVKEGSVYVERGYTTDYNRFLRFDSPGSFLVVFSDSNGYYASGRVVVDGDITTEYRWNARLAGSNHYFTVTYTYRFSDFLAYAEDDVVRHDIRKADDDRFIQRDALMDDLLSSLKASYRSVFGPEVSTSDQRFADYLLSFVQYSITYPDQITETAPHVLSKDGGVGDMFLYGDSEYWAYPIETIHHGYGDCEDTSFLLASLYVKAGYTCSTPTIPGHMVVCVNLDELAYSWNYPGYYMTTLKLLDGRLMYACETAIDYTNWAGNVALGYVNETTHNDLLELTRLYVVEPEDATDSR